MPGWADLGGRVNAAQQVMQAQKGLPERLASAEAALVDMRDHLASINDCLGKLPGQLSSAVRLSVKGSAQFTLVGTERHRIDNPEDIVAISAYVTGAALAAGVSLVFGADATAISPAFKVAVSGPVQSPEWVALSAAPTSPVVVQLFTSWVGGWSAQ